MKARWFLLIVILALGAGCSSRVVNVPVNPYVDPTFRANIVTTVAVFPFVVPEHMQYKNGAEMVSIDITNRFMSELAERGVYQQIDGERIKAALASHYKNPRDWIFSGNAVDAARMARELGADAAVFGQITRYVQGHLSDSEFEMEVSCVEVAGMKRLWSVRQVMVGKGGKKYLNEPETAVPPNELGLLAGEDAASKVQRIRDKGGPIEVVGTGYRRAWGYGVLAGGITLTATSAYFYTAAEDSYQKYRDAENDTDITRYQKQTEEYDKAWQYIGAAGIAAVGTGIYLILTDDTTRTTAESREPRFTLAPAWIGPGTQGVVGVLRF